ncbi:MAG: hypothetical protein JO295_00700 [Verrucomicrobia bacterium]|nr:hypothetical protein [Verrucomicrobiota bacterium]
MPFAHDYSPPPSQEEISRRHRRMQQGLSLAATQSDYSLETKTSPWLDELREFDQDLWWLATLLIAIVATCGVYVCWGSSSTRDSSSYVVANRSPAIEPRIEARRDAFVSSEPLAPPATRTMIAPRGVVPTASSAATIDNAQFVQADQEPSAVPRASRSAALPYVAPMPLPLPPPASPLPTPDFAARDRRIAELKEEAEALDNFIRQIRNNPYVSHSAEPGHYGYYAWQFVRGSFLLQEKFDPYMKRLDKRRDELRREKWQLEGR